MTEAKIRNGKRNSKKYLCKNAENTRNNEEYMWKI